MSHRPFGTETPISGLTAQRFVPRLMSFVLSVLTRRRAHSHARTDDGATWRSRKFAWRHRRVAEQVDRQLEAHVGGPRARHLTRLLGNLSRDVSPGDWDPETQEREVTKQVERMSDAEIEALNVGVDVGDGQRGVEQHVA